VFTSVLPDPLAGALGFFIGTMIMIDQRKDSPEVI
jgi:hypothetical protein